MTEDLLLRTGAVLFFVVVLALEWRYRLRSLRLGAVGLALAGLSLFGLPPIHGAWRVAIGTPSAERVKSWAPFTDPGANPMSDYASGVSTMERAVADMFRETASVRWFTIGVLVWLACSPAFRRAPSVVHRRTDT